MDAVTYAGFYEVPYELRGQRGQIATGGGIALPSLKDGGESCTVKIGLGALRRFGGLDVGAMGHIGVGEGNDKGTYTLGDHLNTGGCLEARIRLFCGARPELFL